MLASSITGEVEYSGWRHRPAEWSIVANIRPQSAGDRLAFRQHGHRRVIAMDALSRQHVILISATNGLSVAVQAPTQSANVETSRSIPSREYISLWRLSGW